MDKWALLREKMEGMKDAMITLGKKDSANDYEFMLLWMDLLDRSEARTKLEV